MNQFRKRGTKVYETRLLLAKTTIMMGEAAARQFYDLDKFERKGATPKRVQKTLLGEGGVQGLDGADHVHRKALFMGCMGKDSIARLRERFESYWEEAMKGWKGAGSVTLFYEVEKILLRAACDWTGVPLPPDQVDRRRSQLSALIDSAAALFLRHLRGRRARKAADAWIAELVEEVRAGTLTVPKESIFHRFCAFEDRHGQPLPAHIVAVEVLNLIRPIVAIARYIIFSAQALHEHPQYEKSLRGASPEDYRRFVQEVRRYYPFFPVAAAKVKAPFEWEGLRFPRGRRVILDLYATNHDATTWEQPGRFKPDRFLDWDGSPFNFIPQGGGDHAHNHRCAGEWITIDLTRTALCYLVERMDYRVPLQNLKIKLNRIPAIPKSRFVISDVRPRPDFAGARHPARP